MCQECRERFPRHRLHRKPLVSDPVMQHGTCVTHLPWCMSGSLTRSGGEHVPGIPDACATRYFTYLVRSQINTNIPYIAFGMLHLVTRSFLEQTMVSAMIMRTVMFPLGDMKPYCRKEAKYAKSTNHKWFSITNVAWTWLYFPQNDLGDSLILNHIVL